LNALQRVLRKDLCAEAVEGLALSLECIDDIEGSDSLATCVLSVCDCITDNVLKEDLEDSAGLLIDEAADTLNTSSASQSANSRLGDSLDVVTQNLAVSLGAALSESLSA